MNWKTIEEAKNTWCQIAYSGAVVEGVSCDCIASECGHWLERPCPYCDNGYRKTYKHISFDSKVTSETTALCSQCNGTGSDGIGLGRCGLINV